MTCICVEGAKTENCSWTWISLESFWKLAFASDHSKAVLWRQNFPWQPLCVFNKPLWRHIWNLWMKAGATWRVISLFLSKSFDRQRKVQSRVRNFTKDRMESLTRKWCVFTRTFLLRWLPLVQIFTNTSYDA